MPIVANGRATPGEPAPSPACRIATIEFLDWLLQNGRVLLDRAGEIQAEYHRHLNPRGQPGVGDRFYMQIVQRVASRVEWIELPLDGVGRFVAFPDVPELARFHDDDRKFAALARQERAPVANATDSDWLDHREALAANGISVDFICGCNRAQWFE